MNKEHKGDVYLQRRSSKEQAVVGVVEADHHREDRLLVLDAVSLVDDQVAPAELLERSLLDDRHLIGGDDHLEVSLLEDVFLEAGAALLVAVELEDVDRGAPPPELVVPVREGRLGGNHEVLAVDVAVVLQVAEQRDSL